MRPLTQAELQKLARTRLGLIVGPDVTLAESNFFFRLRAHLAEEFEVPDHGNYLDVADRVKDAGQSIEVVRQKIVEFVRAQTRSALVAPLARVRWNAVLSGAIDWNLESGLQQEHNARPARPAVAVVTDPYDFPDTANLPVYKLLGSAERRDVLATNADLLRRHPLLAEVSREFVDRVKSSPVICAGFAGAPWLLEPLLGHLFSSRSHNLSRIIFLQSDPMTQMPLLADLVPAAALRVSDGSLIDVCQAVEPSPRRRQMSFTLTSTEGTESRPELPETMADFVVPVSTIPRDHGEGSRGRLLDYLFMPDVPSFEPFLAGLDFRRSLSRELFDSLSSRPAPEKASVVLVHGRAASGKTTMLKRLAVDLAASGRPAFWIRDYWHPDTRDRFAELFEFLARLDAPHAYVFLDDPGKVRELSLDAIIDLAEQCRATFTLVAGMRTSSHQIRQAAADRSFGTDVVDAFELSDELDAQEWQALPEYLVQLEVARDLDEAGRQARAAQGRTRSQDTLALLYWLLPQTRQQIEHSIQTEYLSLGDSKGLQRLLIGTIERSTQDLQDAYGMVAASAQYGVPLPIEVLVSALRFSNYSEWLEAVAPTGPAWGLFYPQDDEDYEGTAYTTRNDVITGAILRLLNGGELSHTAEVALLGRLLHGCNSTNYVYERFCERLLVPHHRLERLEFSEGLSLYNAAEKALPFRSRALLHHKGLWIRAKGSDLNAALGCYDAALSAGAGPQNRRLEQEEFIHTSRATAFVDKIDRGQLSASEGRRQALAALEKSRSPGFVNAHAVDVYAGLVERLAFRYAQESLVDRFELLNRALGDIDRTITMLRVGRGRASRSMQSLERLEERRDGLLGRCLDLGAAADEVWRQHGSQIGFVLETRRLMMPGLTSSDPGAALNEAFEYWTKARAMVGDESLTPDLSEVGLVLYYLWQVQRRNQVLHRTPRSPIDWRLLTRLAEGALASPRYSGSPFYRYVHGLSLAHERNWKNSRIVFDEIRRMQLPSDLLHTPRSYYLSPEGIPWRLEGRIMRSTRLYFQARDIEQEFVIDRPEKWPRGEALKQAYVIFSFAGPRATLSDRQLVR